MTDREQERYQETRKLVFTRAHGRCEVCGRPLNYFTFQMGHRIPQRKHFLKQHGREVIHHYMNFAATCSLRCNNAVSIGNHPVEISQLVQKIIQEIEDGTEEE